MSMNMNMNKYINMTKHIFYSTISLFSLFLLLFNSHIVLAEDIYFTKNKKTIIVTTRDVFQSQGHPPHEEFSVNPNGAIILAPEKSKYGATEQFILAVPCGFDQPFNKHSFIARAVDRLGGGCLQNAVWPTPHYEDRGGAHGGNQKKFMLVPAKVGSTLYEVYRINLALAPSDCDGTHDNAVDAYKTIIQQSVQYVTQEFSPSKENKYTLTIFFPVYNRKHQQSLGNLAKDTDETSLPASISLICILTGHDGRNSDHMEKHDWKKEKKSGRQEYKEGKYY